MESVYVGWLSVLPPIIAITLALITKEVITSLVLGILSGTIIHTIAVGGNIFSGTVTTTFSLLEARMDIGLLVVMGMLGAIVEVITRTGAQHVVGAWAGTKLKTKTGAQLTSVLVASCFFLSDVFHNLTAGTILKPISDSNKVSRAKFSFILDATAAPICCLVPMGIWLAGICAVFPENDIFASDLQLFLANIPYNLYCIIILILVVYFCFPGTDFGAMRREEDKADATGDLGSIDEETKETGNGGPLDMVVPLAVLVAATVFFMLLTGGLWSEGRSVVDAFSNCSTNLSLMCGSFVALAVAFVMFVPRKVVPFRSFMQGVNKGVESMVPAMIILILAWTIGGVCRNLLMTGQFVSQVIVDGNMPIGLLPAIVFIIAAALSFATGTSWGTFGILMPIVFTICEIAAPELLLTTVASVLGGSVWGDHVSPISDTTILASACAGCDHIKHVSTQMPYAIIGGSCAVAGYLVAGFSGGNLALTWIVALALLVGILVVIRLKNRTDRAPQPAESHST